MAKTEIRIGGLGGQGVILCGMIIGKAAAIYDGKHATLIQAFGPEARGSACSAQVTVADQVIGYPYVKQPDVLVLMSQDAYAQFAPTLKPGGRLLYEEELVKVDQKLPGDALTFGIPATRLPRNWAAPRAEHRHGRLLHGRHGARDSEAMEQAVKHPCRRAPRTSTCGLLHKGLEYGRSVTAKAN
jgi:2-oxoglutarate ferredoxin oxidoreductase subunit gamma